MKKRGNTLYLVGAGGVLTVSGFLLATATVPWLVPLSRPVANVMVVAGAAIVVAGWVSIGAGLAGVGRRWRGAVFGFLAYCLVGAVWTAAFVLTDPWGVDYERVDLVRFLVYSMLLWPYAVAYVAGWFGLSSL